MYNPDSLWDSLLSYGLSIDYQRTLYETDFNTYLGAQMYTAIFVAHGGGITTDYESEELDAFEANIVIGAGFRVEIFLFQNFSLPLEFVYKFSYSPTESNISKAFALDVVPRVGSRFRCT